MIQLNEINLDLGRLDDYITNVRRRLEEPINGKLVELEERRAQMLRLLEVANVLQQDETINEINEKLGLVDQCVASLKSLWDSHNGPPTAPPAVTVDQDEVVPVPPAEEPPLPETIGESSEKAAEEQPAEEPQPEGETAEETVMAAEENENAMGPDDHRSETDRIAEEALRESRRRGYVGAQNMKASPNTAPQRNYEVTPANNPLGNATSNALSFIADLRQPGR